MASADVVGPFGPHPRLKEVLTRETQQHHRQRDGPVTPASRRQHQEAQILDRWAAHQAREMVATIERQAELSALSSTAQPVSARAATFLRDASPANSASSAAGSVDLRPNVTASSLIQMWRELEADSGVPSSPTRGGEGGASGERKLARQQSGSFVRLRCRRGMEELMERMQKEREEEVGTVAEMKRVSKFSHHGRIQSMLKLRFLRKDFFTNQNQARPVPRKTAPERSESRATILFLRKRFDNQSQNIRGVPVMKRPITVNVQFRIDSQDSCSSRSADQFNTENNQCQEVISIEGPESLRPESTSPQSRSEDLHVGSQSAELKIRHSRTEEQNEATQSPECFNSLDSASKDLYKRSQSPELTLLHSTTEYLCEGSKSSEIDSLCFSNGDALEVLQSSELNSRHFCSEYLQEGSQSPELNSLHSTTEYLCEGSKSSEIDSLCFSNGDELEVLQSSELNSPHSCSEYPQEGSQSPELNSLHSTTEYLCEGSQSPDIDSLCFRSGDVMEILQSSELNSRHSCSEYPQEGSQSPEPSSLHFRSEDLDDGSQRTEVSWDERNSWMRNLDWQRTMESSNVHGWQSGTEVVPEEIKPYTQQDIVNTAHTWTGGSYISWRGWEIDSQEYRDYFETFSDKVEIRELLKRRMVTTSLESDFCDKMNRIMMTLLQRQREQYVDESSSEEDGEQPGWRYNYEFNNADRAASDSSLVPSSYQTVQFPESWQHTSVVTQHSSHNLQELENVHDLKNEMSKMRQEISDLRKLVQSCMEWQAKLQGSIKNEISSAIRQSVLVAETSEGSERTPGQKGSCCVCNEMQVDSLFYRCGHMCTCFKCANELQWRSGACPICQAPIVDVVRAYPNT